MNTTVLLLDHGTDWSSWFNMASPPGMGGNISMVTRYNDHLIFGIPAEIAQGFSLLIPFLVFLMMGVACLPEAQAFALPPRFLRCKTITTWWCISFIFLLILTNLGDSEAAC